MVVVAFSVVFLLAGMPQDRTPPSPVITFGSVSLSGTTASFAVADSSFSLDRSNYRINLRVNGTFGIAEALDASGTGVAISVTSVSYTVTYTDVDNDGYVNRGDQFTVMGMRGATQYVFVILWSDGSLIQSRAWATP